MAGITKTRVDVGDKGPVKMSDDKRSGGNKQDSSIPQPTRANLPVGGSENDFTSEESAAKPTTRPNSGSK